MIEISLGADTFERSAALAAWAGVFVNAAVVITAFVVQRLQARSDARTAMSGAKLAAQHLWRAVDRVTGQLAGYAEWLNNGDDDFERAAQPLERGLVTLEHLMRQPVNDFDAIDAAITLQHDARELLTNVRRMMSVSDGSFEALLRPIERSTMAIEASTSRLRWSIISSQAQRALT